MPALWFWFVLAVVTAQKCKTDSFFSDFLYLQPRIYISDPAAEAAVSMTSIAGLYTLEPRGFESSVGSDGSGSSSLEAYTFEFSFPKGFTDETKRDWELHNILDFDHGNHGTNPRNFIDLVAYPWLAVDGSMKLKFDLELMSQKENELVRRVKFDTIIQVPYFYDEDFAVRVEAALDEASESASISFFKGGSRYFHKDSDSSPALYNTIKDFKSLSAGSEPLSYRPLIKILRRDMTFQKGEYNKRFGDESPFDSLRDPNSRSTAVSRQMAFIIKDPAGLFESQLMTPSFLVTPYNDSASSETGHRVLLYDNIGDKVLEAGQYHSPKIDAVSLDEGESQASLSFNLIQQENAVSFDLVGPLTNSGMDLILTLPIRLPLENFVASHRLAVSLVSDLQLAGDLELSIRVYLQKRVFPYEVVSEVYDLDYSKQMNGVAQNLTLSPIVGLDPSQEQDQTAVDLVIDLSMNDEGAKAIQEALAISSVSLGFQDIVIMKEGSRPVCLESLNEIEMEVRNVMEPIDEGFNEKEESARGTMVFLIVVYFIVGIIIIALTFLRSMTQKNGESNLHRIVQENEVLIEDRKKLLQDRQVLYAIAQVQQEEATRQTQINNRQQPSPNFANQEVELRNLPRAQRQIPPGARPPAQRRTPQQQPEQEEETPFGNIPDNQLGPEKFNYPPRTLSPDTSSEESSSSGSCSQGSSSEESEGTTPKDTSQKSTRKETLPTQKSRKSKKSTHQQSESSSRFGKDHELTPLDHVQPFTLEDDVDKEY